MISARWSWLVMVGVVVASASFTGAGAAPISASDGRAGAAGATVAVAAKPLPPKAVVPHPYLAPQNSIHVDMYNSGVTDTAGPLGEGSRVWSPRYDSVLGTCLNFFVDGDGRLFGFCGVLAELGAGELIEFQVVLFDVRTLRKRASYSVAELSLKDLVDIPLYFGYLVLDADGRVIAVDERNRALFIGVAPGSQPPVLMRRAMLDFSDVVDPAVERVAAVVPDYAGDYWFFTLGTAASGEAPLRPAMVGVREREGGATAIHTFAGEVIENGMAVGPDGVYLVTDRALYRLTYDAGGEGIRIEWREPYDRGQSAKPGSISRGAGATPTLLGERYIAITDNADERVNLLVYDRLAEGDRLRCKVPLFASGASANENSVIGYGRSLVVQNWYNAQPMFLGDQRQVVPGLWRVDVRADGSGCDVVWRNDQLAALGTMKLSTATGMLYGTVLDRTLTDVDQWVAVTVDFETGQEVSRTVLGRGLRANPAYYPTYLGPRATLIQPVFSGIAAVRDRSR